MEEESAYHNSSVLTGHNDTEDSIAQRLLETALFVDKYYTPVLFFFGTLGNSLSLAVFCMNSKYRSQSASYYLSALAISDTGFLLNLLAVWLETVLGGVITSGIMCPLVMYLGQVTCFMSVYLTVAFSIERYVAVHYPLSRPRICTRSKARKIIAALTAIALLVFSYAWVIAEVVELPTRREDYDDLYRDKTGGFNSSQEIPSDFIPFPDEEGKMGMRNNLFERGSAFTMTEKVFISHRQAKNATKHFPKRVFHDLHKNCDGNMRLMTTFNDSISSQNRNESRNCSGSRLDSRNLPGIGRFPTEESGEDSYSTSVESRDGGDAEYFSPGIYICSVPSDYFGISEIANYLDSIVTLIIPFFLITFFNVRIAMCVWKLKDQRQNMVATATTDNINHSTQKCFNAHRGGRKKEQSELQHQQPKRQYLTQKRKDQESSKEIGVEGEDVEDECRESALGTSISNVKGQRDAAAGVRDSRCTIRFTSGETTEQPNSTSSSEGGSEENSLAENCGYSMNSKNKFLSPPHDTNCHCASSGEDSSYSPHLGLSENVKTTSTMETLKASPRLLGKSTASGGFGEESKDASGEVTITRKNREPKKSQSPSPRLTGKPEIVRERGSSHHPSSNASEVRVTKTLLLVSTVFLVLNLPAHAIRCAQFIQTLRGTKEGQDVLQAAQLWTNILFNTNFAVNFLLYCLSGRNFRKSLRNIILRKFNKKSKSSSPWKPTKTGRQNYYNSAPSTSNARLPGTKRNFMRELQVTEIVELEDVREQSIYPSNTNGNTVTFADIKENDDDV